MRLFLDPRLHGADDYRFSTLWALRCRGIHYPFVVSSGPVAARRDHFLGSEKGAHSLAARLDAPRVSVAKLICVTDPATPLALSEPGARFLSVAEAERLVNAVKASPELALIESP